MFQFENCITIDCPIEDVFALATDLPSIPKWNYYVRSVVATSEPSGVQGATYHQVRKDDEQALRIVELRPNESFVVETVPPSRPALRRHMLFTTDGESTTITDRWSLDLGVPKLLEPLAANRAKNGVRENLGKLKILLETGKVTLQDGQIHTL
jgi:uncharacterized membrane protein